MSDHLFDLDEECPEVPLVRPKPHRRKSDGDARFRGEYPPEWKSCRTCDGRGRLGALVPEGEVFRSDRMHAHLDDEGRMLWARHLGPVEWECPDCLGTGSVKARVRFEAGHRCLRCQHPYIPKGDAKMLGVKPSGHEGWSPCDERCDHGGPIRYRFGHDFPWTEVELDPATGAGAAAHVEIEAAWRVLTVHHADGDKANLAWWNLLALCQRCHLEIQAKVVMERVYILEHSDWFKPFAAGYYAHVYLCATCGLHRDDLVAGHGGKFADGDAKSHPFVPLELSREEAEARLEELLDLERAPA